MSNACKSRSDSDKSTGPLIACFRTTSRISRGTEGIPDNHDMTSASSHSSTGLPTKWSAGAATVLRAAFFPDIGIGGVTLTILKEPSTCGGVAVPMLLRREGPGEAFALCTKRPSVIIHAC